jgi:LysR family nitrogen assimilation transcriptional regulator
MLRAMQLRHLRYFVKIVEAGSFSRAAATIHVAQPALSQQIADLEARLGLPLLHRSARGVRPTLAGEALYREANAILRRVEELPAIIRATDGEIAGTVTLGMSTTLAASFAGPLMELCRATWPQVNLRFTTGDSLVVRARIESGQLDIGVVFEDALTPGITRQALFRHRLFLVRRAGEVADGVPVTLPDVAAQPLILPAHPNVTRSLLDRAFQEAGLRPIVAAETDVLTSMLSAVQAGVGGTIIPKGVVSDLPGHANLVAVPIEPPLHLTASIAVAEGAPVSRAAEAVRAVFADLVETRFGETPPPGVEWIGP